MTGWLLIIVGAAIFAVGLRGIKRFRRPSVPVAPRICQEWLHAEPLAGYPFELFGKPPKLPGEYTGELLAYRIKRPYVEGDWQFPKPKTYPYDHQIQGV